MFQDLLHRIRTATEPPVVDLTFAAAVLFAEVAWADNDLASAEVEVMQNLLADQFGLPPGTAAEIVKNGLSHHDSSVGVQEFTRAITDHWGEQARYDLLVRLWELAFSDQVIDKYEDHTIRRIADLLYVSHARFIQAKHQAKSHVL